MAESSTEQPFSRPLAWEDVVERGPDDNYWYATSNFNPTDKANGKPYPPSLRIGAGCAQYPSYHVVISTDGTFRTFEATVALDDTDAENTHYTVVFKNGGTAIGKPLEIGKFEEQKVSVPIEGVTGLRIEVTNDNAASFQCGGGPAPFAAIVFGNASFNR